MEINPEVLSTLAIVCYALILIFLERKFPYTLGQKVFRKGFFLDFFWYTVAQSYFMGLIIFGLINYIDSQTGISRYSIVSDWPLGLQILFFFLVHDFYIYCFHRMQHKFTFLWRFHQAHHSVQDVDWLAGSRSHPVEILINQTIEFAPIILLGAAAEVALVKGIIDAFWGMFIHSNINVKMGKLQIIVNGPEMHRWHHSNLDERAYNKNFSTKLAIWDWLFGTAFLPTDEKPKVYGISSEDFPEPIEPESKSILKKIYNSILDDSVKYIKQVIYAFKKDYTA